MNTPLDWRAQPTPHGVLAAREIHLSRRGRRVLQDVSLKAHPGRVLALIGPNGAGKSTLLAVLAGLLDPAPGSVTLDGRLLASWIPQELAQRRAMLSQHVHLAFDFRAEEVVMLGRAKHGPALPGGQDEAIVAAAMQRARVTHLKGRKYLDLSGGEQRRVQLARVLAQLGEPGASPNWLLLDEPDAGLDIAHQHEILQQAQAMSRQGCGVIVVLHDLNLTARYADDVALLAHGRLLCAGSAQHALDPAILSKAYGIPMRRMPVEGRPWIMAMP